MPGAKGKSGGKREGAGRRYKTRFAIPSPIISDVERSTADVTLSYCHCCPAIWWDNYTVTRWGAEESTPDGPHWPILATEFVEGQPEIHRKGCPAGNE